MPEIDQGSCLLGRLTLSRRMAREMSFLAFGLFLLFCILFAGMYYAVTGKAISMSLTSLKDAALFLLLTLLPVPLHELTHGAIIRWYGGRPSYGVELDHFVLPYAYTVSKGVFTRRQFIAILLGPLVVLSAAGMILLLLGLPWLLIPLASNAAGSIGDLWMTFQLLRFPSKVQILDERSGLSVYGAAELQGRVALEMPRVGGFLVAWLKFAVICFSLAMLVVLSAILPAAMLLRSLGVPSFALGLPESLLLTYRAQDACLSLHEPGVLFLGGVCASAGLLLAMAPRRARGPGPKPACDQNRGDAARMCLP